jgi:hypothetical protein
MSSDPNTASRLIESGCWVKSGGIEHAKLPRNGTAGIVVTLAPETTVMASAAPLISPEFVALAAMRGAATRADAVHQSTYRLLMHSACPPRCLLAPPAPV